MSKVFTIADCHFPYHSRRAYKMMLKHLKREKPTHVVQIGDVLDQYVFSKYPRGMSISPKQDIEQGLMFLHDMWADVKCIAPRAVCHQLLGNHDMRLPKRIAEKLPEFKELNNPLAIYKVPGVTLVKNDRSIVTIDGVAYVHGWLSKSIDHALHLGMPTVHGHRHRPAIETKGKLWSMDVGFLGDENKLPFSYTPSRTTNWRLACGVVEDGKQPRLIFL